MLLFLEKMNVVSENYEHIGDFGNCEILLYKNIRNSQKLHSAIIEGKIKCAMIKPALIAHPLQIAVATKKSLAAKYASSSANTNSKTKGLMTKSVFTEILYNLAPTKNIAESLKLYGIGQEDTEILIVITKEPGTEQDEVKNVLINEIDGDLVPNLMDEIEGLPSLTNWELVSKVHKLKSTSLNKKNIVDILISRAATKDVS